MATKGKQRKPRNFATTLRRLMAMAWRNPLLVVMLIVMIALETAFLTLAPLVIRTIANHIAGVADGKSIDFSFVTTQCLILVAMYVIGHCASWQDNRLAVLISQKIVKRLRDDAQRKINRMPLKYIDGHPIGDLLSRVTNDVSTLSSMLDTTVIKLISQVLTIVGTLIAMLCLDVRLSVIFLIMVPLSYLIMQSISRIAQPMYKRRQRLVGELNSIMDDAYTNHDVMQAFCCEDRIRKDFDELNDKVTRMYVRSRFVTGFLLPASKLLNNLAYIALCVLGGILLVKGDLDIGSFQAFLIYAGLIDTPIQTLAGSFNSLALGVASAERIFEFLDAPELPDEGEPKHTLGSARGEVEFSHVQFGYVPGKQLMHDVSFKAMPGQTMAVVGPSGAGKTTLVNLLMRFYDIQGGAIRIDGVDARDLSKRNLREQFGMVLQDTWLFEGTIAENIGYGKPGATREEIVAAAKAVNCDSFIDKLPDGYDTVIRDGNSALSAGERQLLTIARIVLADPNILILDEATSQVDTKTELLITQAMEHIMRGRTSFIIAHRLLTIRNADCILYMENGDILEVGSHEQLMALNGKYAALYRSASD